MNDTAPAGRFSRLPLRFSRLEWAGAFGDVGILLPLALALIARNGMNATAVFLCAGLMYIACGLYYRIPVPVQPLKAAAAIAIAQHLGPEYLAATGLLMGATLLLMAVTRVADLLKRVFTAPIIRGIQLGVGLLMIQGGLAMIAKPPLAAGAGPGTLVTPFGSVPMGLVFAAGAACLLLALAGSRRVPASLVVLAAGVGLGLAAGRTALPAGLALGPAPLHAGLPSPAVVASAFLMLVIPQLPLTFGNAIVCASRTARDYYGPRARRVTPVALSTSLGIGNLVTGLLGGMPMCHGSGGLTAHYRFGARTAAAPLIVGTTLVLMALLFGGQSVALAGLIPPAVLGVLLMYIGVEHAMLLRHVMNDREGFFVALTIGGVTVVAGTLAAVCMGLAVSFLLRRFPLPAHG